MKILKAIFRNYLLAFYRCFDFLGRSSRAEYLSFMLINFIAVSLFAILGQYKSFFIIPLLGVYILLVFIPFCSATIRRIHDVNYSAIIFFTFIIPIFIFPAYNDFISFVFLAISGAGFFITLTLSVFKGSEKENKYGVVNKKVYDDFNNKAFKELLLDIFKKLLLSVLLLIVSAFAIKLGLGIALFSLLIIVMVIFEFKGEAKH